MPNGIEKWIHPARVSWLFLLLCLPKCVLAQRVEDSCHAFFNNPHQALDCVEAIFSQKDIPYHLPHLTVSSIAPGNGFPIGVALEKRTNFVSSPFYSPNGSGSPSTEFKSLVDAKVAFVFSTNTSWYATGTVTWLPPVHYRSETKPDGSTCHRIGLICSTQVLGVSFYVTHGTFQTIGFFGLGPSSPNSPLLYRQSETYGGAAARLPLSGWLVIEGQIENRKPEIAFSSISLATGRITEAAAPGFATQPDFMHYGAGLSTHVQAISEPVTNDPATTSPGAPEPPLMKHKLVFIFDNNATENWYSDLDTGHYSFRQLVIDGQESIKLDSVVRRFVAPDSMTTKLKVLKHFCNGRKTGLKVKDECGFGELNFRPLLVVSTASTADVPFYLQPTLGGSNIDSRPTLRGFSDYRFRAPDAAMIGADYEVPVWDPVGALLFYDVGQVGNSIGDLSFAHARQDAGIGATLRLMKNVVAQVYLGFGAGHGSHLGYNFTKFF